MSKHQQQDTVLLAYIRAEFEASYYSYGRPRMVEELREKGFDIGHTRVGRLMRDNGLKAIRTRKRRYQNNNRITHGWHAKLTGHWHLNLYHPN
ncbi:MAG: transposase [Rhizobiales bacterium]|nr:transposase [Hyphomicrobiales bacterium]